MWDENKTQLKNTSETLQCINDLVRQGKGAQAKTILLSINTKKLSTGVERTLFANLARRLSLPNEALKVLHPYVRPSGKRFSECTETEKIEYAASLIKIGANGEALNILKSISDSLHPEVLLFKSFALMATWDYEEAVEYLLKYITTSSLSQYEVLVAKANLCGVLVYLKHSDAEKVIEECLRAAQKNKYTIIVGHVEMSKCVLAMEKKEWEVAEEALAVAGNCFSVSDTIEAFFVKKWRAILDFYRKDSHDTKALDAIREEAKNKWNHWETVRDCDYHQALVKRDKKLLYRLYFGTPFHSFRKRLLRNWEKAEILPKVYQWSFSVKGEKSQTLELFSGDSSERVKLIKSRKQYATLLGALCSDFYRPMTTAVLFFKLYPDDFFNPDTSLTKLRLAIFRTRKWLKIEKLPLAISEKDGTYCLSATKNVEIVVPMNLNEIYAKTVLQKSDLLKTGLTESKEFSVQEACLKLKVTRRSMNRLLSEAIANGLIVRFGTGNKIKYVWTVDVLSIAKAG